MRFKKVEDRLSMLPDEILSNILSLMSTKYAVRTSALSKSWRYRWTLVNNFDFRYTHSIRGSGPHSFTSFVDRALKLCKTSQLKLFRLHSSYDFVSKLSVSNWINEAARLNTCELDIQVKMMKLPLSMLTCKTLTKLRLDLSSPGCHLMQEIRWEEFPYQVNLPCMKTLDMAFLINPFINAFKLINGCPILESLSWKVICCHRNEENYTFNIPTLKRLKLELQNYASNKVVLNVPNLEYLFVGGMLSSIYVMKDVSSLVEASVSFCEVRYGHGHDHDHDHMWAKLLTGLSGVKSLSFQNVTLFPLSLPCFSNMKHLKLTSSWNSGRIIQFLESSPELEHVYIEKLQVSPWIEPNLVPTCMLTNLTTIKFSISSMWQECDTWFLKYMLGNAEMLKAVTIIPENSSNVKGGRLLRAKLVKFPRASKCCEMHFHGN